jgi:F0F1-type ATP synthase membrane subunit c/vacuolar-type H+-ATPase subunit K
VSGWAVAAVVVLGLLLSGVGGWPLTSAVLRLAGRTSDAETGRSGAPAEDADPADTGPADTDPAHADAADTDPGDPGTTSPAATGSTDDAAPAPVLRGGTWIGILERLAVTGCLAAGYPAGIAYVIAVKGLGRSPELRDHPGLSERFVIGTLTSLVWAGLVGAAVRGLVT